MNLFYEHLLKITGNCPTTAAADLDTVMQGGIPRDGDSVPESKSETTSATATPSTASTASAASARNSVGARESSKPDQGSYGSVQGTCGDSQGRVAGSGGFKESDR